MSSQPWVPPGWYADPWRRAQWRWWDGYRWTPALASDGVTWMDGWPGDPPVAPPADSGAAVPLDVVLEDAPPSFPSAGLRAAIVGFFGGFISASVLVAVVLVLTGEDATAPGVTVAGLVGLWSWLVGACVVASRRHGTGSLRADFGLRWQRFGLLRGLGANVVARIVTFIVAVPIVAAGASSSNTTVIQNQKSSALALTVVAVAAVVGAPIVEELFFRGLVLRSLSSRLGFGKAVVVQGVVFGLAHANPAAGWRTLSLVTITATFGICQGVFARRWQLGPLAVSHALFNLLPVLIIALR